MVVLLRALVACALAVFMSSAATATDVDDEVFLEISGAVKGGPVRLSRAEIEKLPMHKIRTHTPWHSDVPEFEGVLMRDLLNAVEAKGGQIYVTAINKYATTVPMDDFTAYDAILAYKKDGKYMSVREKGPFFIVYPYDSDPALKAERYYVRSAWQVASIVVQ